MPPVTLQRVGARVDPEKPATGFMMEPVIETADGRPLGWLGGGIRRDGQAQPVEVERSHRSAGINPKYMRRA